MRRKAAVVAMAVVVMLVGTVIASTAFTNATVERDANIDVVADDSAPISLADGNTGNVVYLASNGELTVDFANPAGSSGINPNATYELGDTSAPSTTYAFTVTNEDSQSHDLTFSYALDGGDPAGSVENVNFTVTDSGGNTVTASETSTGTVTLSSGETAYVVVTVNSTTLTSADDLSGTLTIEDNTP